MLIDIKLSLNKNFEIDPSETLFICGSIKPLGSWDINESVELDKCENADSEDYLKWSKSIETAVEDLAELTTVEYKCFIARKYTQNGERKFFLRKIQSNPRSFAVNVGSQQEKIEVCDVWELQKKEAIGNLA